MTSFAVSSLGSDMASGPPGDAPPVRGGAYDYAGPILWEYSPHLDRDADPGEVVWTWVAYEDDPTVGKDRPVAIVGRTADHRLVALMLSSRNHDGQQNWWPIGAGTWDAEGRNSWVRRDRVLAVPANAVRREGAVLPRPVYDALVAGLKSASPEAARPGLAARLRRMFSRSR